MILLWYRCVWTVQVCLLWQAFWGEQIHQEPTLIADIKRGSGGYDPVMNVLINVMRVERWCSVLTMVSLTVSIITQCIKHFNCFYSCATNKLCSVFWRLVWCYKMFLYSPCTIIITIYLSFLFLSSTVMLCAEVHLMYCFEIMNCLVSCCSQRIFYVMCFCRSTEKKEVAKRKVKDY